MHMNGGGVTEGAAWPAPSSPNSATEPRHRRRGVCSCDVKAPSQFASSELLRSLGYCTGEVRAAVIDFGGPHHPGAYPRLGWPDDRRVVGDPDMLMQHDGPYRRLVMREMGRLTRKAA